LPGDRQGTTEGSDFRSSQTLWENGDNRGGNRRLSDRFGTTGEDSEGSVCQWGDREGPYYRASRRSQEKGGQGPRAKWIQGGGKMMSKIINLPWISHNLTVTESSDPSLIGISGTVLNETKRTILISTKSGEVALAKDVITFTIDSGEPINGSIVTQRAEERIGRRY